nr:hypothetical protein [Tanacetum cinerariifolium]
GHYCIPQALFNNPEPGYSQDFNFPQDIHDFNNNISVVISVVGPHETFQCQQELAEYIYTLGWNRPAFYDDDDDVDYTIAITPVLSTEEPIDSLSMGDEHLDTIQATGSDEVIKSSVENLVPIPSESEGIPEHKCDVPFHYNSPPFDVSKDQIEDFSESNNEVSSIDDDSFEASPPDSELVSSEVMEIVIPEVEEIDDDILLTIKDDNLCEKLLNVHLLIANIEALKDNPTPSSKLLVFLHLVLFISFCLILSLCFWINVSAMTSFVFVFVF